MDKLKLRHQMPVVLTGGEPLLFVDGDFVQDLRREGYEPHIETNGTIAYDDCGEAMPFITVSPKVPFNKMKLKSAHTLKMLWPTFNKNITPESFSEFKTVTRYLQPLSGEFEKTLDFLKSTYKIF